ncbi:hypothetical protein, partial [Sinorhizobium medicae]
FDPKVPTPKSASANQGNPRAKGIVASSAATLVSDRAYRPQPFPQSTTNFKKLRENRKWLFLKELFFRPRTDPKPGRVAIVFLSARAQESPCLPVLYG